MQVDLKVLIGAMLVLGVTAIGLTVWLLRLLRRSEQKKPKATGKTPRQRDGVEPRPAAVDDLPSAVAAPAATVDPPTALDSPQPAVAPALAVQSHNPAPEPGETLLMQVWQDREGYLVIEVEGQRYRRLFDVRDGAVGRWLLETINRLVAFSKGQETRAVAPPASQPPAPALAVPTLSPDAVVEEKSQAYLEQLKQQEEAAPKKPRISADPIPLRRRSEARERSITLNLAGEIDQLLQIRVKASPEFSQRYIHVADTPAGELRFDIDGTRYYSLDEITDLQVQAVIRAAIADWEAKR